MDVKNNKIHGELKISEDVIKKVTILALSDVKGVASQSENKNIFGKSQSVKLKNLGGVIEITVHIIVTKDCNVSNVSANVQNTVKENVQNMTGIPVSRVDVVVDGIEFDNYKGV